MQSPSDSHHRVERIVNDIDEIVKKVPHPRLGSTRLPENGWSRRNYGERCCGYKLHTDQELFDKAYRFVAEYY